MLAETVGDRGASIRDNDDAHDVRRVEGQNGATQQSGRCYVNNADVTLPAWKDCVYAETEELFMGNLGDDLST